MLLVFCIQHAKQKPYLLLSYASGSNNKLCSLQCYLWIEVDLVFGQVFYCSCILYHALFASLKLGHPARKTAWSCYLSAALRWRYFCCVPFLKSREANLVACFFNLFVLFVLEHATCKLHVKNLALTKEAPGRQA